VALLAVACRRDLLNVTDCRNNKLTFVQGQEPGRKKDGEIRETGMGSGRQHQSPHRIDYLWLDGTLPRVSGSSQEGHVALEKAYLVEYGPRLHLSKSVGTDKA
jgi:hypothetical protein